MPETDDSVVRFKIQFKSWAIMIHSICIFIIKKSLNRNFYTLKPQYSEQILQTLFVHYMELFTISNVICSINPQNCSLYREIHYIEVRYIKI